MRYATIERWLGYHLAVVRFHAQSEAMRVPGLDFNRLRAEISMQQVLNLLGFEPVGHRGGEQIYGPCPLHQPATDRDRCFSVNLKMSRYRCHKCGSFGNALELWAAARNMKIFAAALDLCSRLGIEPPWIERW